MKLNFWNNEKVPKEAGKVLLPRSEFIKKAKGRFLAAFDAHYRTYKKPHSVSIYKTAIVFVALFALLAGASAYADTNNVAVTSPLYPLKRLNENVRLALASPEGKADIQATLVTRRADEINDLQTSEPSSTEISVLRKELQATIQASIEDEAKADPQGTKVGAFCGRLLSALQISSSVTSIEWSLYPRAMERVETKCGQYE